MHTFIMVIGAVAFPAAALFVIVVGARALPRIATVFALSGLGLGYLADGPWCAAFGAFVGLFIAGWAGTLVRAHRGPPMFTKGLRELERFLSAIDADDFAAARKIGERNPAWFRRYANPTREQAYLASEIEARVSSRTRGQRRASRP